MTHQQKRATISALQSVGVCGMVRTDVICRGSKNAHSALWTQACAIALRLCSWWRVRDGKSDGPRPRHLRPLAVGMRRTSRSNPASPISMVPNARIVCTVSYQEATHALSPPLPPLRIAGAPDTDIVTCSSHIQF